MNIIIFGFAHSGTSILKSIIGHCDNVHEHIYESSIIKQPHKSKHNLCKYPYYISDINNNKIYEQYYKIFLMRNPVYVYSSINRRFSNNITNSRISIDNYLVALQKFDEFRNKNTSNMTTILYKDLFINNFQNIRDILNSIGINYNNDIFDNTKYVNLISSKVREPPKHEPKPIDHDKYRTFQINLPFKNMNDPNKINLTEHQKDIFKSNPLIQQYFPENKNLL